MWDGANVSEDYAAPIFMAKTQTSTSWIFVTVKTSNLANAQLT
jgi:hypothetical protein